MEKKKTFELTSAALHIIAMVFMLCDHLWATVIPSNDWLTCVGRLAFPIFAFMTVEGYFHTRNFKNYMLRLLLFAVLSELPFNLMAGGSLFYPIHQNVLWTFLIALLMVHWNERTKRKKEWLRLLVALASLVLGGFTGLITMVDYYHAGVLTVLVFYFFRGRKWWCYVGQALCLWYINAEMLGGFGYELSLFGQPFFLARQSLALLSLPVIWLYRGRQGHHSRVWQYCCYAFYPAHLLVLGVLGRLL